MSNPYQLRSELLTLARDILESQSRARVMQGNGKNPVPHGVDVITTEQVIAEAEKLNKFVSQTNNTVIEGDLVVKGNILADENVKSYEHPRYRGQR